MAKRTLFWHIGPMTAETAFLAPALEHLADPSLIKVHTPTADQARRADVDLRRAHRAAGYSRSEVEGEWSRLESMIWHNKGTWLMSTPAAGLADRDQFHLAMDGLKGVKVHFVIFVTPETADEVDDILRVWRQPLHPERVHVVSCQSSPEAIWNAFLTTAGVSPVPLPEGSGALAADSAHADLLRLAVDEIEAGRPDVLGHAASLLADDADGRQDGEGRGEQRQGDDAAAVAARALARAAEQLAARDVQIERLRADNERLDRKRRKHKRRVRELEDLATESAEPAGPADVRERTLNPVA